MSIVRGEQDVARVVRKMNRGWCAVAAGLVLAAGCAAPESDTEPVAGAAMPIAATRPDSASPAPPPAAANAGRVEGIARYVGTSPLRVKVLTNDLDVAACGERIRLESVVLGAGGSLGNVFVELRREDGRLVVPTIASTGSTTVAIERCALQPHVLVIPAGSALEIRNADGILHDLVAPALRNEPLELRLPRYRKRLTLDATALRRPEKIQVSCTVHPWEIGWWIVSDNPLRALTDADGRFVIEGIPPGTWQVMAWHEGLNRTEMQATVLPDETVRIDLDFR